MPTSVHDLGAASVPCPDCGSLLVHTVCPTCTYEQLFPDTAEGPARGENGREALNMAFGRYTLQRRLAAGGMGVIYVAEDHLNRQTVALKMIRASTFANEAEIARFTVEAEAASALDHPHITPVYEVGTVEGQPYFTMRLIDGLSLAERLKQAPGHKLPAREVASCLSKIARAVHHAHERGILHRDLKPANILLDECDHPWLTDFGLAKLLNQDCGLTLTTDHLGTPNYMAPEVVEGSAKAVSTATDVWALGVILWEALCGESPFKSEGPIDVMRRIAEEEPTLSSTKGVDNDLLTLAQRCLEKDPKRRIASASKFADELDRWLRQEPMRVRPVTPRERLWKCVKRKPALAALAAALVVGALSSLRQWHRAEQAVDSLTASNDSLTQLLARSEATSLAAEARLRVVDDPTKALLLAVESVELTERLGAGVLPEAAESLTETLQRIGGVDISPFGPRPSMQSDGFIDRAPALTHPVRISPDGHWVLVLDHHTVPNSITAAIFDLKASERRLVHRWTFLNEHSICRSECWLADSRRFVTVDRKGWVHLWTPDLAQQQRDAASVPSCSLLGELGVAGTLTHIELARLVGEGNALSCRAVIEQGGLCSLFHYHIDPTADDPVTLVRQQTLTDVFAKDGTNWQLSPCKQWAVGRDREVTRLFRLSGEQAHQRDVATFPQSFKWIVPTFSPDGRWLALRHGTSAVHLVDLNHESSAAAAATGKELFVCEGIVETMAFSPDSSWLAAGGNSAEILVASTDGRMRRRLKIQGESMLAVQFSPDGQWLGAGSREGTVTVWSVAGLMEGTQPLVFRGLPTPALDVVFTPSGDSILVTGMTSHFRHWQVSGDQVGSLPKLISGRGEAVRDMALSADKRWIALACAQDHQNSDKNLGAVKLLDAHGELEAQVLDFHGDLASGVAFSPGGDWLASVGFDGYVKVWSLKSLLESLKTHAQVIPARHVFDMAPTRVGYSRRLAFHPRGTLYASCGDGLLFEWDLNHSQPESTVRKHHVHSIGYQLPDVTVSPDGRMLAVARHGWDQEPAEGETQFGNMVLLYDVSQASTLTFIDALPAMFYDSTSVNFSHDSRWLAAGSAGHGALVWDLHAHDIGSSRLEASISAHVLGDVAFSPDGQWLSIAGSDGRLHLWDWRSQQRPRTIITGRAQAALGWLDTTQLVAGGADGQVAIWETDVKRLKEEARTLAGRPLSEPERSRFGIR